MAEIFFVGRDKNLAALLLQLPSYRAWLGATRRHRNEIELTEQPEPPSGRDLRLGHLQRASASLVPSWIFHVSTAEFGTVRA